MSTGAGTPPHELGELAAGAVIGGKYTLVEMIGHGGMGRVWRARRSGDGRELALKLVGLNAHEDVRWRRRFEREAKLLSQLGELSPHIVRVEDYDFDPAVGPYLAMELLSGETLAARLADSVRLPARDVLRIVNELCDALGVAHREGVIHRDIKPSNIFLHRVAGGNELLKLLDFGVAKIRGGIL